jgi:hypothetical protein
MIEFEKLRLNLICLYCSSPPHIVKIQIKNINDKFDMRAGNIDNNYDIGRIDMVKHLHKWNTPLEKITKDLSK